MEEDGRDTTVKCWTDYFIKDYLAHLPQNKLLIGKWVKEKLDDATYKTQIEALSAVKDDPSIVPGIFPLEGTKA